MPDEHELFPDGPTLPQYGEWGGNGPNDAWVWAQGAVDLVRSVNPTNPALNGLEFVTGQNGQSTGVLVRSAGNGAILRAWAYSGVQIVGHTLA